MIKGEGGFIGTYLSSYANIQPAANIRAAITDPNRNVDYRKWVLIVTMADGQTLTGVAREKKTTFRCGFRPVTAHCICSTLGLRNI